MNELTQGMLKELLDYDEESGIFTWKFSRRGVKKGTVAGTLKDGYININIFGRFYRAHRLVWLYFYGKFPVSYIDHIDGIRSNNRLNNLREATTSENNYNQRMSRANTSGVKGVSWYKRDNNWEARIGVKGKYLFLGRFSTIEEAEQAIKIKREELHKEFANHG